MPRFSILLPAAAAPIRDARQIDVNNNNNNQTLAESLMNGLEVSSTYAVSLIEVEPLSWYFSSYMHWDIAHF